MFLTNPQAVVNYVSLKNTDQKRRIFTLVRKESSLSILTKPYFFYFSLILWNISFIFLTQ